MQLNPGFAALELCDLYSYLTSASSFLHRCSGT